MHYLTNERFEYNLTKVKESKHKQTDINSDLSPQLLKLDIKNCKSLPLSVIHTKFKL
jgi:hypothetical protein